MVTILVYLICECRSLRAYLSFSGAVLYVGASEDLDTRRRSHYKKLRRGVHLDEFQEWYSVNGVIPSLEFWNIPMFRRLTIKKYIGSIN